MSATDRRGDKTLSRQGLIGRRGLLLGAGAASLALAAGCSGAGDSGGRSLRVSSYGGSFEQALREHIYPLFTEATGIRVESMPQPAGLQFLLQLIEANKAGQPPMDLCISAPVDVMRGNAAGLWRSYDAARIPNLANLPEAYVTRGPEGVAAVGAVGWFFTMVTNPQVISPTPTSWTELWAPGRRNAWGLAGTGAGPMFEVTAATYFDGPDMLDTEAGIRACVEKMAGLKPNTRLWWESEGTMQTALENGEVQGGVYFADVAETLIQSGANLEVVFPREGPVIDFGSWCQPSASTKTEEAHEFINFMLTPQAQNLIASRMNAPPLIREDLLTMDAAVRAKVTSPTPPITTNIEARRLHMDLMVREFSQMLAS
jgi:putative spermidine/putrescine transport system substrate-binding protein